MVFPKQIIKTKAIMKLLLGTLFFTSIFFLDSCTSCENTNSQKTEGSTIDFESLTMIDSTEAIFYALPSPEEVISYINASDASFDANLLFDATKAKLIINEEQKAIALGAYLADMAYVSSFERNNYMTEYIGAIDYLMRDLNINPDFTIEQQKLIYNSSYNTESFYLISRELYDVIVNYLENFDDGKTLSLISIGALTEIMFIATNLNNNLKGDRIPIERIAEQKLIFQDVLMMVKAYEFIHYKTLYADLAGIEKSFELFDFNSSVKEVKNNEDGSIQITGSSSSSISSEDYSSFITSLSTFRNKLIN